MDGRKALLRMLIVASLATTTNAANLVADDFIRPPAKNKPVPVRVGTISQPTANPSHLSQSESPAAVSTPTAPVATQPTSRPAEQLDLTPPSTSNPLKLATRPASEPVPAQETSARPTGSQLNWQARGGRPSLSVTANRAARETSTNTSATNEDPLGNQSVPQVPANQTNGDVRLIVPARPEDAAAAEQLQQRREMAARISNELVGSSQDNSGESLSAIEPGPGWQAVGDELKQHVQKCEELLARKAYRSAMQEADQAIVRLARVLDLKQNRFVSEPLWGQAQQALREAQEFTSVQRISTDSNLFARLIQSHETPVLKEANVSELTPLVAAQHYRAYAEQCLVSAAQGHPWFCELYYCLGRSLQSQADTQPAKADILLHQSLAYFRAAQSIDPNNATNANQLAYVLLKLDRPAEALGQLQQVVQLPDCPLEAWQNLAQAGSRLGDSQTERWAVDNYLAAKARGAAPSGPVNTLVQVSEEQFRAMSPMTIGPSTAMTSGGNMNMYPNMQMTGPMNSGGNGNMAPAPGADSAGRTAILPRTGWFR